MRVARDNFSRRFILSGMAAAGVLLAAPAVRASTALPLHMRCLHTDRFVVIDDPGRPRHTDIEAFNDFCRDWRAGLSREMDPELLSIMSKLNGKTGGGEWTLVSGYRSPKTNAALPGTAKRSLHMQGMALDIRHSEIRMDDLASLAVELRVGGVGRYRRSDFVHVDTGTVRSWGR